MLSLNIGNDKNNPVFDKENLHPLVIGYIMFIISLTFRFRENQWIYIIILFHLVTNILTKIFHLGIVNKSLVNSPNFD